VGAYREVVSIFDYLGYFKYIVEEENAGYLFYSKTEPTKTVDIELLKNLFGHGNFIGSNSKKMLVNVWKNKPEIEGTYLDDEFYFNYEHPFITFVVDQHNLISANTEYKKIVRAAISFISELYSAEAISAEAVQKINEMILPLKEISEFELLKISDF
jgi:hypothetical protein